MPIDPPNPNGEGEEDTLGFGFDEFDEAEESRLLNKACGDEGGDGEA
jgi:hypothetical protein